MADSYSVTKVAPGSIYSTPTEANYLDVTRRVRNLEEQSPVAGPTGPAGPSGPNNITTATTTNLTGVLKGNGSNVSGSATATDVDALKRDGSNANATINLQGQTLETTGSLGAGTITPRRKIDALDASNPQIRATHTENSVYADFKTDSNGYLMINPTGQRTGYNVPYAEANLHVGGSTGSTLLMELLVGGSGSQGLQFKNSNAGLNHKFFDLSVGEYQVIYRFPNDNFTDAKNFLKVTKGGADGYTPVSVDFEYGNVTIGGEYGTARLQLPAGTTAAESAPLKFLSGASLTTPEAGAVEYTTDDLFFTIDTGTARKRFVLADPTAGLTSGRVPYATTNGRLKDDAGLTFDGTNLATTGTCASAGFKVGSTAGIDATIPVAPVAPATVAGSMTFTKGILTAYTAPS